MSPFCLPRKQDIKNIYWENHLSGHFSIISIISAGLHLVVFSAIKINKSSLSGAVFWQCLLFGHSELSLSILTEWQCCLIH